MQRKYDKYVIVGIMTVLFVLSSITYTARSTLFAISRENKEVSISCEFDYDFS